MKLPPISGCRKYAFPVVRGYRLANPPVADNPEMNPLVTRLKQFPVTLSTIPSASAFDTVFAFANVSDPSVSKRRACPTANP
jgi:hypothetical protein